MEKICRSDGEKVPFDERKLYASVYAPALEAEFDHEEAEEIADMVVDAVVDWMADHEDNVVTTDEIREHAATSLEDAGYDDVAFLYRTHLDLN